MQIEETNLAGCVLIKPTVFEDSRGYFFERFNKLKFEDTIRQSVNFIQDNQAKSDYGVVRGLHFQKGDHVQAKLVGVVRGAVLDVVVDCRKDSKTYLDTYAVELTDENHYQLFVPRGFAHGYSVLKDDTIFTYKCDNYYNKQSEGGIYFADNQLNIDWRIPLDKMIISEKDKALKSLR